MATIKPIESRTVHQIQSGQVIIDLCSVVKELVENSVDAGATSIDVRFRNQGLDLIEVQDNGAGISTANYESVCLKHHTSKLSTYDDLASLQTFGFRGEALASLCALSTLNIITCLAIDVPKGTKLSFEPSGRLQATAVVAAQKGTTVSVNNIFHNLPVRRRELERNIKREWQKVIALLNQYACILTGLKFTVSQQPSKGKRIILFSTKGNATTRENIINIFSAKMTNQLVPLDLQLEMEPSVSGHALRIVGNNDAQLQTSKHVRVVGHVSRPVHGEGRQTPDRQMFFVNGRPCGLPQFAKTFNEVYRSYNATQSPFICADIRLDTDMYDVNVSPDKRSIMLHDQHKMLDTLRASLITLFDDHEYTVPMASLSRKTPTKLELKLPRPSDIHTKGLDSAPEAPSSDQSDMSGTDDDSDNEEDEGSDQRQHRTNHESSHLSKRSARRIPSANSLSRGGPHSQSLLHHWVKSGTSKAQRSRRASTGPPERKPSDAHAPALGHRNGSPNSCLDTPGKLEHTSEEASIHDFQSSEHSPSNRLGTNSGNAFDAAERVPPARELHNPPELINVPDDIRIASRSTKLLPVTHINMSAAPQLATITIGNEPTTDWIVSSAKRRRSVTPESNGSFRSSFGSRLTQLYASADQNPSSAQQARSTQQFPESTDTSEDERMSGVEEGVGGLHYAHRRVSPRVPCSSDNDNDSNPADDNELFVPDEKPTSLQSSTAEDAQPRAEAFEAARRRKDATITLQQDLQLDETGLEIAMAQWASTVVMSTREICASEKIEDITDPDAESKLSLVISRGDFSRMRVAGQFNLGFIIAVRPMSLSSEELVTKDDDELFIIDQHASDEKYNFERLQSDTIVQSQRLVLPKRLGLSALEEEIIMQHLPAIEANGFKVNIDTSGDAPVGARCQLLALPLSRETTFDLTDLEELISLLGDTSNESSHVPRPAKVRKMFAMRACRSSVMIGKALTQSQMYGLVKHMGEMDKPWNCPHGRPTMRHLCRLQPLGSRGWRDDIGAVPRTSWAAYTGSGATESQ